MGLKHLVHDYSKKLGIFFSSLLGMTSSTLVNSHSQAAPPPGYELVWADDFDGKELDPEKWTHRRLGPRRKAINQRENVSLDGKGNLVITTRKENGSYTTGMIGTQDTFLAQYGYFETRVKFQTQEGHWSAFWLQSPLIEIEQDPDIAGTEIDIFEYHRRDHLLNMALHWQGYKRQHQQIRHRSYDPGLGAGYHTFALLWTPDSYTFYVNHQLKWFTQLSVSQIPQYMILSLEVDRWAGDIQKAKLPDSILFDYVKVYQLP